jgi:hydroxylamine reductase (hybrid-cluster protein)
MTDLIACLSSGEKSWAHIARLIKEQDWKKIFLITNEFGKNNFKSEKEVEFIVVDIQKPIFELIDDIRNGLRGKITDIEVALNIVSGSGKEHMAILSALLKLGVGIRLMAVTKEGVREL